MSTNLIFHITQRADWERSVAAGQPYVSETLSTDGFIHCSTLPQLLGPANVLFHGQSGLALLCIALDKLQPDVIYEDCYQTGYQFPHVYGPLNLDAVVKVVDFPPNPDGSFSLPEEL